MPRRGNTPTEQPVRLVRTRRVGKTGQPEWTEGAGGVAVPGMAVCPHSGSSPWFDVTGGESLLAPGSAALPVFQPVHGTNRTDEP